MKRLLIIVLLATTVSIGAMQKSFNYDTYKFNIPTQGLKVGDMFTITNVDPFASSQETLKDATGRDWAKKLSSVYPGGKTRPGKGTATFKVLILPTTQRAAMQPAQQPVTKPAAQPAAPVAATIIKAKPQQQQAKTVIMEPQKPEIGIIQPQQVQRVVQKEPVWENATRVPAAAAQPTTSSHILKNVKVADVPGFFNVEISRGNQLLWNRMYVGSKSIGQSGERSFELEIPGGLPLMNGDVIRIYNGAPGGATGSQIFDYIISNQTPSKLELMIDENAAEVEAL